MIRQLHDGTPIASHYSTSSSLRNNPDGGRCPKSFSQAPLTHEAAGAAALWSSLRPSDGNVEGIGRVGPSWVPTGENTGKAHDQSSTTVRGQAPPSI
ncbi:hypothetical protein PC114_g14101 [Phytophthora cactorum]|nr:hypothetical protein PC114_g14101 [Phytophthora cactorum]KAG3179052.1 hypothetical protein PC128_g16101 [Phytophthora cactorum]KAG4059119.1 hypothetical protein PC123_g5916 [Phytophthora cactorum]